MFCTPSGIVIGSPRTGSHSLTHALSRDPLYRTKMGMTNQKVEGKGQRKLLGQCQYQLRRGTTPVGGIHNREESLAGPQGRARGDPVKRARHQLPVPRKYARPDRRLDPAGDDGGLSKFQTTELRSRSSPGIAAPLNAPGRTFSFFSTTRAR